MRRTLLLIALLIAASSLALGQTNVHTIRYVQTDNSSASTQCRGEQLSVRHLDNDDAAMGGYRSEDFAFTNTSSSPCTLRGYPRFELLNRAGRPVRGGRAVNSDKLPAQEESQSPQLAALEPGKTAWFQIVYNSGGAGHMGKPCPTSPKVKITAPGTTRGFILRDEIQACKNRVEISPVRNGMPEQ